jgi:pyridoxamine 5'-phosphate oxidase
LIEPNPIERFRAVYEMAEKLDRVLVPDPNAMALGTIEEGGQPSVRIVLLKSFDERGCVFYTNYHGRKGRHLLAHPKAALCFHWPPLEIQVRVEGSVTKVADEEADAYFATRQRLSQIGAWASLQSEPIEHPADLEERVAKYEKEFEGKQVPRPQHWSGFRVAPERMEFWKNRPNRLHERHLYVRQDGGWKIETLYP